MMRGVAFTAFRARLGPPLLQRTVALSVVRRGLCASPSNSLALPPLTPVAPEKLLNPHLWAYVDHSLDLPALCAESVAAMLVAPRRFGKSTLLSLRRAYLELPNADAERLFAPFKVADTLRAAIKAGRKPVPVIHLNMAIEADYANDDEQTVVNAKRFTRDSVNGQIRDQAKRISKLPDEVVAPAVKQKLLQYQPDPSNVNRSLIDLIEILGFAAINIDEFDYCVLASVLKKEPIECRRAREEVLQGLFSAIKDNFLVHSTMVTGITVHVWRSLSNAANFMTLLNEDPRRPRLGYTWNEMLAAFEPNLQELAKQSNPPRTMDELKTDLTWMYDGYRFRPTEEPLFNPFSINSLLNRKPTDHLPAFWARTVANMWTSGLVDVDVVKHIQTSKVEVRTDALFGGASAGSTPLGKEQQHALLVHTGILSALPAATESRSWSFALPNAEVRSVTVEDLLNRLYKIEAQDLTILRGRAAELLASGDIPTFFKMLWPTLTFPRNKIGMAADAQQTTSSLSVDERVVSAGMTMIVSSFLKQARTKGFDVTVFAEAGPHTSQDRMDVVFLRCQKEDDAPQTSPRAAVLEVIEFAVVDAGKKSRAPSQRAIHSKLKAKQQQLARYDSQLKQNPAVHPSVTLRYWVVLVGRDGTLISTTDTGSVEWTVPNA